MILLEFLKTALVAEDILHNWDGKSKVKEIEFYVGEFTITCQTKMNAVKTTYYKDNSEAYSYSVIAEIVRIQHVTKGEHILYLQNQLNELIKQILKL